MGRRDLVRNVRRCLADDAEAARDGIQREVIACEGGQFFPSM
jgi:hypothetical protein